MIITEWEQGTFEWLEARIGVLTGTRAASIITTAKMQISAASKTMVLRLIDENVTRISSDKFFSTKDTERGNELEPMARKEYIKKTGININEHGLCLSDKHPLHGCSPDGFTDDFKGAVEIKCPGFAHLEYIKADTFPMQYKLQIINYFVVNEKLEWLDFVSFRPEFYPQPLFIKRITREELEKGIAKFEVAIDSFFIEYKTELDNFLF